MKQEDKQYEAWLSELKNKQPILKNPEELTTAILNSISPSPSRSKHGRRKFLIGAWLSGLAAAVLLLLFINDAYLSPMPQQNEYGDWQNSTSFSLPENWKEMGLQEKNNYLSSQFTRHRQLRQTRIIQLIKENRSK